VTELDAMELCKRAISGDDEALMEFLELQQSGRGLRCYPLGRKSAEDFGAVAVGIYFEDGVMLIRTGMKSIVIPVPIHKAIEVVRTIGEKYPSTPAQETNVRAILYEDNIYLLMGTNDKRYEFNPEQAVGIGLKLRDALIEKASAEGLNAIDSMLAKIGES
jgi:hypothetical protein